LEDVANVGFCDEVVIAFKPMVAVLSDKRRIMTGLDRTHVIDHSKQRIPVAFKISS
jgi:hypothetical protein